MATGGATTCKWLLRVDDGFGIRLSLDSVQVESLSSIYTAVNVALDTVLQRLPHHPRRVQQHGHQLLRRGGDRGAAAVHRHAALPGVHQQQHGGILLRSMGESSKLDSDG